MPHIALTLRKAELMPTGCFVEQALKLQSTTVCQISSSFLLETVALPSSSSDSDCKRRPPFLRDRPPEPTPGLRWPLSSPARLDFIFFCFVFELYPHATLSKTSCNITLKFIFCLLHKHCNITVNTIYIFERYKR